MSGTGLLLALFETSANDRGEFLNFKASAGYIMLNPEMERASRQTDAPDPHPDCVPGQ